MKAINLARQEVDKDELEKMPASITGSFQGTAQAFQASLRNEPYLILAALVDSLHRAGHSVRKLHPPDYDSLDPPLGGRGSAVDAALYAYRPERDGADRHHPVDWHREEERDHDDRLCPGSRAQRGEESGGGDLRSLRPAVSPDHHDDHGRAAGRFAPGPGNRYRRRAAAAAGPGDRGGADLQPDADPLHHPGRVSLSGSLPAVGGPSAGPSAGPNDRCPGRHRAGRRALRCNCRPRHGAR